MKDKKHWRKFEVEGSSHLNSLMGDESF